MSLTWKRLLPVTALFVAVFALVATQVFALSFTYDQTVLWGSDHDETVQRMARDSSGNIYILGWFQSASVDFDPGAGTDTHTSTTRDIYVSKFTADMEQVWTKTFAGGGADEAYGIAVDESNNALYIAGSFYNTLDLDPGAGTQNRSTPDGYHDAFLVKLNLNGEYVWDFVIDGHQNQMFEDVAVDDDGNVYVTGWTDAGTGQLVDLDPGVGTATFDPVGSQDSIVAKYTSNGEYVWSHAVTGADSKYQNIKIVGNQVYLSGSLYTDDGESVDYDPGAGVDNHTSPTWVAAVISKYSTDGDYQWTRSIVPGSDDGDVWSWQHRMADMAVDLDGGVYIGGTYTATSVDFDGTDGTDIRTGSGYGNAYLTKYNADGSYGWTRTLNVGMDEDRVESITVTSEGAVFAAGFVGGYDTYDFDGTEGEDSIALPADAAFITQYSTEGEYGDTLIFLEDNYTQHLPGIVATNNTLWVAGSIADTADFDGTAGTDVLGPNHFRLDGFLTKYGYTTATLPDIPPGGGDDGGGEEPPEEENELLPDHLWTKTWGGIERDRLKATTLDDQGNMYVTGDFRSTNVDLDPGAGSDIHTGGNGIEQPLFVGKFDPNGDYLWGKSILIEGIFQPEKIAVDSEGNVYVSGAFQGVDVDFDPGEGSELFTSANSGGNWSGFVLKLSSNGEYVWNKTVGDTTGNTYYVSLALDSENNVLLAGKTLASTLDVDPNEGTDQKDMAGAQDTFVTKLSSDGSYDWTRTQFGSDSEYIADVAAGNSGDVYFGGYSRSTIVGFEGTDETIANDTEGVAAYFAKYDTDGNFVWLRYSMDDSGVYMDYFTIDEDENVYGGSSYYGDVDFDGTDGVDLFTPADGSGDAFVVKYDKDGNYQYTVVTSIADSYEEAWYITIDGGYMYFGGYADEGTHDFDPGSGEDIKEITELSYYLSQVDAETGQYVGTILLTNNDSDGYAHEVFAENGTLVVVGEFASSDAEFGEEYSPESVAGNEDFFMSLYSLSSNPNYSGEDGNNSGAQSSSSSGSRFVSKSSHCSAAAPLAPDLFQIDTHSSSAVLYFVPSASMDHYWVTYGMGESYEQFGVKSWNTSRGGAVRFEINELQPNTEYSFRILPVNGCMPGDWSKIIKVKTAAKPTLQPTSYYAQ